MNKKSPDGNREKVLANLEAHPAALKRCQEFYLDRVVNRKTYEELGKDYGVGIATAHGYVQAYRKIAEKYADTPAVSDVLAFCHAEIARLLQKRKEFESAREYKDLTGEIRHYQMMVNEVSGLTRKGTEMNINYVTNTINVITSELPTLLEQHLPKETVNNILLALAEKLEETIKR